jgi:hypothetical protein
MELGSVRAMVKFIQVQQTSRSEKTTFYTTGTDCRVQDAIANSNKRKAVRDRLQRLPTVLLPLTPRVAIMLTHALQLLPHGPMSMGSCQLPTNIMRRSELHSRTTLHGTLRTV